MKRKLTALLLVLLLAVTLAVPALAAGDWVTDEAGLLTDQQISQLSQRAAALAHSSGVGVYIRTVDDYADYGFTDVETASYTLYHNDSLGVGDGRDGVLLLLSVSNRKYAAFVYGDKAELLFPDSALQQLEDGFLDDFRNDDWYGGFCDYIDGCAGLLSGESYTGSDSDYAYSPGHDADVDPGFSAPSLLRNLGIALVISCVIALIVCLILKAKMRSVRRQTEARAYVTPAGLHLTRRDDVYTHTTTTRRKIERDNDQHSGGGGSSFSGGSAKTLSHFRDSVFSCLRDGDADLGHEFFRVARQAVVDHRDLAREVRRRGCAERRGSARAAYPARAGSGWC